MARSRSQAELILRQQIQAMKNKLAAQEVEAKQKQYRQLLQQSGVIERLRARLRRAERRPKSP